MRYRGQHRRYRDHVGRVLHQHACVAMVRMVVVRAVANDQIGVPFADEFGDELAVFEGGQQFAVVDVQHFDFDPENARGFLDFLLATDGQGPAGFAPMADVAIGDGNEFHFVSLGGPERGRAAGLKFAIVRMSPEGDDAEFAVGVRSRNGGREGEGTNDQREGASEGFHGKRVAIYRRAGKREVAAAHHAARGGWRCFAWG